jgi:hypothetical protein
MDFLSFGLAGLAMLAGVTLAPMALLALAIPYTVLRLRTDGQPDSQLGLKVALYFFISASVLLALSGLTMISADLISRDAAPTRSAEEGSYGGPAFGSKSEGGFNTICRTGVALIISGIIGWVAHHLMLKRTAATNRARIQRTFVGFRFAISGLVLFGTLTLLLVLMLQEGAFRRPALNTLRGVIGIVIVWLPTWLLHLGLFFQLAKAQPREAGEKVAITV